MHHLYEYSYDYTLQGLVEIGYLEKDDLEEILLTGHTKEEIVKAIQEILYQD